MNSPRSSIADRLVDRPVTSPPTKPASSGDTLSVACRLPTGVMLSMYEWEDYDEPTPSGAARPSKRAVELMDKRITLRGWSMPGAPAGTVNPVGTAHGYGLTHGVPRDTFERWLADNRNSPLVRNRIIFAADSPDRASDEARELDNNGRDGGVKSGLESLTVGRPGEPNPDRRLGKDRLIPMTADVRR